MLLTREDHAFVPPAHAIGHRFASIVCRSGPQTSYLARSLDLAAIVDVFQTVINIQNLVTLRKWLADAEGRGADATITEEQRALILAVACEPPEKSGYPHTHWTNRLLAAEVIKRGIVEYIY